MTFVHPTFLWALAALAVPVIIHLFNFRKYKKVYFTNVKFLRELQEESKSRSRLKELLVLLARCLAIACLVLAFCQPVLLNNGGPAVTVGPHALSLYIDNSFSMQNVNRQGPVFDVAKSRAKEVVKAYGSTDRFQVITNDFEGRHQRWLSREDALNAIDELKVSPAVRPLSDVLERQSEFMASSSSSNKKIVVFSDAQKSTFNLGASRPDTGIRTILVPLRANRVNNVYVDSCWFETPLQQQGFIQKLHARIVNRGNSRLDIGSAKLFVDQQQVALSSFSVGANADAEVKFTFECKKGGFNYGTIKIEDYPVTFDDELFFAFNSTMHVAVSLINGRNVPAANPFTALLKSDSIFKLSAFTEQTIDYASFKTSDVIILNQLSELSSGLQSELLKFTAQGGAVLFVPSPDANAASYNSALAALSLPQLGALDTTRLKADRIELATKFYAGVFEKTDERINLPFVNRHYKLGKGNKLDFETILVLQNGDDFFGQATVNNAQLYLFSAPLDERSGNFSKHALFVPTIYRLCFSALRPSPLFYTVGSNMAVNLKNDAGAGEAPPHIKQKDSEVDLIPEMRVVNNSLFLYTRGQVAKPGFYEVTRNGQSLLPMAFNYSRRESDLESYEETELSKIISDKGWRSISLLDDSDSDIPNQVREGDEGKKLWKLFIVLALLFVLIETALLRLLK